MPVARPITTDTFLGMMLKPINLPADMQECMCFWAPLLTVRDSQGAGSQTSTFTRATVATHVNAAGTLVRDASGDARFEADGYLSETARTNILLRSDDLTNAAWVATTRRS